MVWKLDRLGRSLSHLVRILDDLKGRGVAFRSLTEGIDITIGAAARRHSATGGTHIQNWMGLGSAPDPGGSTGADSAPSAGAAFSGHDPPRSDRARARPQTISSVMMISIRFEC